MSFKAGISNESPYDCAVLLLDPCLIVLSVCPRPCDLKSRSEAPINDGVVHEHAIVVEVDASQGKGKQTAHAKQRLDDERTIADKQGNTLGPARGDVSSHERLDEAT